MEVIIYVAEVRNYGPDDRIGSAIPPVRTLFSFEPIPKSEKIVTYIEGGKEFRRVIRTTGGEIPGYRLDHLGGELSTWAGRKVFKLPRTNWMIPEALLARARAGAPDVRFSKPRPMPRGPLGVTFGPAPIGPIEPTQQASFAW